MPALVQSGSKFQLQNTSGTISVLLNNITAGNTLIAIYHPQQAVGSQTFTDTAGNPWQTLAKFSDPNTGELTWFLYVQNCGGGSNTVSGHTQGGTAFGAFLVVFEFSGLGPLDKSSGAGAAITSGAPAPISTLMVTTGVANAFAIALFTGEKAGASASNTYTPGAGWTQGTQAGGEINNATLTWDSFSVETQTIPNAGTVVQGTGSTQAGVNVDSFLLTFGSAAAPTSPRLLLSLGVGI